MASQRSDTRNTNSIVPNKVKEQRYEEEEITYTENKAVLGESEVLEEEVKIFGHNGRKKKKSQIQL